MADENYEIDSSSLVAINRNELRAPEANEMLERTPSWLFRWGVMSMVLIFIIVLSVAMIVKYPDTLEGNAVITTDPLPIRLKSELGGRIAHIFLKDASLVQKKAPIAEIENPTGYENIRQLQNSIDSINQYLDNDNDAGIFALIANPLQSLGDAQAFYNQLLQQLSSRLLLHKEQLYKKRTQNLEHQIGNLKSISQIEQTEEQLIVEELKQSDERFRANEQLYKDKIISRQEYYDEAAKLRQKKLQLEQQKSAAIQNNINSSDNNKQMLEIQYERQEKERTLTVGIQEALRNISNYIQVWQQRYLLMAPYDGTVQYLRPLQLNEPTTAGEELFAILPSQHTFLAVIMLPSTGIGKVKIGQKTHLLLDNYPYNEFGFLEGIVIKRSSLPEIQKSTSPQQSSQSMYRVYVQMPDTLITSYHKEIAFSPEMTATARIITKDRNLLQRLIAGIAKVSK